MEFNENENCIKRMPKRERKVSTGRFDLYFILQASGQSLGKFIDWMKIVENATANRRRLAKARRHGCNRIVNTVQNEQFALHPLVPVLVVSRRSINIYGISFIRAASKREPRVNALGSRCGPTRREVTSFC